MVFRRFVVLLAGRFAVIGAVMAALVWLALQPGYHSATLLTAAVLALLAAELWRYISRTNREVSRFLDAMRFADYSQRFDYEKSGSGFASLGRTFTAIIEEMRTRRSGQEADVRRLNALIEHIPVPLMTLHADDTITLQNNAARRLFGAARVTGIADLRQFGGSFFKSVDEAVPGQRRLITFTVEGIEYKLTLAATEIIITGNRERLISLQDIQTELDVTQAESWEDLVRVLTHEIMNSITPVTSLARTASDLVDDVVERARNGLPAAEIAGELEDVRDAVTTVARRSDSLMQFIDSYRQISRLAPPEIRRVSIADLFETVSNLAIAEWPAIGNTLVTKIAPPGLDVHADRDLLEPVLLNLLRNAVHATGDVDQPHIELRGRLNRRGNVVIEVTDNGPGVPEEIANKIFVPFFTTRDGGSGVGLALARQVMIAHGGFIRLSRSGTAGATFSLTF